MGATKWWAGLLVLMLAVFAAGCGSLSTADGAKKMQDTLSAMQKDVAAGDAVKVKQESEDLEQTWEKFEDNVKKTHKELYDKVEAPLGVIQAGAGKSPLDQAVLGKSIADLNAALDALAQSQ